MNLKIPQKTYVLFIFNKDLMYLKTTKHLNKPLPMYRVGRLMINYL